MTVSDVNTKLPDDPEQSQHNGAAHDTSKNGSPREINGFKWFCVCVGLYITAILVGLDTAIAADIQGSVLASLGEIEKLAWVGIGFPMGSAAMILLFGSLYGLFEIKWLYISSIVVFEVGSALCGAAPTMNALIVGRVIGGVGGIGMYIGCLNYISIFTTPKERALYIALIGMSYGTGLILGPVIGGAFAVSSATWRWSFYINLVLAAVTAPVYFAWFPRWNPRPQESVLTKLRPIDWLGAALHAAVFALFMIVMTFSGAIWRWQSGGVIALWVMFGVALLTYILQQRYSIFTTPEHRIFPVQFLKSRSLIFLYVGTAAPATAAFVSIYYIPLFFQFTKGDSAIKAAVRLLPLVTLLIFGIVLNGALMPIFGRYSPWYLASGIFTIIGGALLYKVTETTHTGAIYGFEILVAFGSGLSTQVGFTVAAVLVKPEEVPASIGFISVAQLGSIAIALAIAGSIFQNLGFDNLRDALAGYNYPDSELRSALAGEKSQLLAGGNEDVRNKAVAAIVKTISTEYILVITAGALLVVCGVVMKPEKLNLDPAKAVAEAEKEIETEAKVEDEPESKEDSVPVKEAS